MGGATLSFSLCLFSQLGSTLNGKNLPLKRQILFIKNRPVLGKFVFPRESKKKSESLSPFETGQENIAI